MRQRIFLFFPKEILPGTSRVRITKEGIKIERVAVYKSFRGKNIGIDLVQYIKNEYIPAKKKIYLNSRIQAMFFIKKSDLK